MIPTNYQEWHFCITTICNINLTETYIKERLKVLQDNKSTETKVFEKKYGRAYLDTIITWYHIALSETRL